jgi:hypothetical protein
MCTLKRHTRPHFPLPPWRNAGTLPCNDHCIIDTGPHPNSAAPLGPHSSHRLRDQGKNRERAAREKSTKTTVLSHRKAGKIGQRVQNTLLALINLPSNVRVHRLTRRLDIASRKRTHRAKSRQTRNRERCARKIGRAMQ